MTFAQTYLQAVVQIVIKISLRLCDVYAEITMSVEF